MYLFNQDLRELHRKEIFELTSVNKKLEKQNSELTAGFKKQLLLVDNLKKQRVGISKYTFNVFLRFLTGCIF